MGLNFLLSEESSKTFDQGYIVFSSPSTFTIYPKNGQKQWDGTLEYSMNNGSSWNTWNGSDFLSSTKILFRGTGNTVLTDQSVNYKVRGFKIDGSNVSITGNIENLLDYKTVVRGDHPTCGNYAFNYVFYSCSALIESPSVGMINIPYAAFDTAFRSCDNLVKAGDILAKTVGYSGMMNMYASCKSLTSIKMTNLTSVVDYGMYQMFILCESLKNPIVKMPSQVGKYTCYRMFEQCKNLECIPYLPATYISDDCYESMFRECPKIGLSTSQSASFNTPYRIPSSGNATYVGSTSLYRMFYLSGGSVDWPNANTTYYTNATVI